MKTHVRILVLIFCCAYAQVQNAFGQFNGASVSEYAFASPPSITDVDNSGNDIAEFNSSRYEVTVVDDNANWLNGGMLWNITGIYTSEGYIKFSYSADEYHDPDVSLVMDAHNNVIAVAVYLAAVSAGGGVYNNVFVMECFFFDPPSNKFLSGGTTLIGTYSSAASIPSDYDFEVNVDAEVVNHDKFMITWNDDSKNYVFGRMGWANGCANLCDNTYTIYDAAGVGDGSETTLPDVAFNYDKVYFVYLVEEYVGMAQWEKFEVCSVAVSTSIEGLCGDVSPSPIFRSPQNAFDNYDDPRIACPNINSSAYSPTSDDYSVIASETDYGSYWNFVGQNYNNLSGSTWTSSYIDGLYSPSYDLTRLPNYEPTISYTEDGNIIVGWLFYNNTIYGNSTSSAELIANYPVALNCNANGRPLGGAQYMNVPNSAMTTNDNSGTLSIAGRSCTCSGTTGPENLFSFGVYSGGASTPDIYTKTVPEGNAALRLASTNGKKDDISVNSLLYSNQLINDFDENEKFEFRIFDLLSQQVFVVEGSLSIIRQEYQKHQNDFNPGVYVAQMVDKDGTISVADKLFINNLE